MRHQLLRLSLLSIFIAACGAVEEDGDAVEGVEAELGAAFTSFSLPGNPLLKEQQFAFGPDKDAYACFLSRLSGPKTGDFSWANLIRDPGGSRWYLRSAGQTDVGATCVDVNWFQSIGAGRLQRTTGEGNYDHADGSATADGSPGNLDLDEAPLWPASAASHITGMYGYLNHPYALTTIQEGSTGTTPSRVVARADADFVQAYSGSLLVGTPGTLKAAYVGPAYQFIHTSTFWRNQYMAKTSEAVCFFTQVGGDLIGPDDVMRIRPILDAGVERWLLQVRAGSGGRIDVGVRCMSRKQPS